MNTELTRRALLAGGVVLAGGGAWWLLDRRRPLGERELAVLRLAESVRLPDAELGPRYLELYREEADGDELFSLLFPGAGGGGEEELRSRLQEGIDRDWQALETVQLDGWIMARTEGRFLALVSLLEERRPSAGG